MEKATITISCSECGKTITMAEEDAIIRWRFNGGCPVWVVRVKCSHCKQTSAVPQTPEAKKLLERRMNSEKSKLKSF